MSSKACALELKLKLKLNPLAILRVEDSLLGYNCLLNTFLYMFVTENKLRPVGIQSAGFVAGDGVF